MLNMSYRTWLPQSQKDLMSSVVKTLSAFVLSLGSTRLALEMGGGPPSLFWPTNGVVILFMVHSSNTVTQLAMLVSGILGIAWGQTHIVDMPFALKLGMANASEIVSAVLPMSCYHSVLDKAQSFRFIVALILFVSGLNCIIGATSGTFVITSEFPGSDFIITWTDWLVGDVTGNFIVVYTWYTTKHSFKVSEVRSLKDGIRVVRYYLSIENVVQTSIAMVSICITILVYCVEFPSNTLGIPFVLLTTPVIASLGLVFPSLVVGIIDTILVVLITICTRNKLGPIYSVFGDLSHRDVFIGVQLTFLITYVLSAVLSVVRGKNISREKSLEESVRTRVAFFSHISHELRTPLSVISGYTEGILNHEHIPEGIREDLNNVMEASTTMTTTVNDLLAVFRSEGHYLDVERSPVKMIDFFPSIISLVTQLSEKKGIGLEVTVDEDIPTNLLIDPRRVRQVMLNMIGNSIKYTRRGGLIEVHASLLECEEDNLLRVTIKDSGVGIKEEDIPKLFSRFFRCSHTSDEQGTGLGLTVCQEIIRSMGGSISVKSVFGRGTTFTFEIPTWHPDVESTLEYNVVTDITHSESSKNLHILVVEDSVLNKKLLVRILERQGHIVDSVTDGVSAVSAIFTGKYDVILLDLGLPLKSGIEVMKDTRANEWERVSKVPIIVTSGNVEEETRENCLKEGCNAFADKPFREDDIKDALISVTRCSDDVFF